MDIKRTRTGDSGLNDMANNNNRSVEYLAELQGRDGSIKFRQMSKGDPIVGMILRVHKNPIRSASWNIPYPSDATDEEKLAIDVIKSRLLGDTGTEFDKFLGKILSMLEYGFSLFEQYYEPVDVDGSTYLLPVVEQRMQTSIQDILPKEQVVRQLTIENGTVDIPFKDLLFFTLNQQGEDLRGESILRNAYGTWKEKKVYREWKGIGAQRSVAGVPSVTVPKNCDVDSKEYIAVEQLLQNICQGERSYMILQDGYSFTIHESKFNAEQMQKAVDACNSEMALSVLAQFVMLGQQGNTGAFALSRDQSDFFLDGLQYIIDLICGTINSGIIRPYLDINFGDRIDPKRVCLYGMNLNKKAGVELSQVLNTLKMAGFITPTVDDEVQLRDNLQMPELTEDEIEKRKTSIPAPATTPIQGDKAIKFSENTARKARAEYIANTNKEVLDFMQANLMLIKDKLLADVEATLKRGTVEIQGLKSIEVSSAKYLKGLQMKLAGIAIESWNRAKKSAKTNNVKFAEGADPKEIADKALKQFVLNQAQSITDKQASGMLNRAILTASNNSLKGLSIAQTISNTSRSIDDYIASSGIQVDGSLIVVGTANFGETQFYKEIQDQIWGYRFVNNSPESEICQWYVGKTFSVDSPELAQATPPLHPNCDSYLEPIYKTESEPEIDNVIAPPTIQSGKTIF